MTGTTKLAFFLLFTFASMITYDTRVLLGLLVVSLLAFRLSRIKFREVRFMMTFMLVFLLLNNLFIFLFDPNQGTTLYGTRTVLCHLFWRYDLTAEQLFYMVNICLKYFVALPVAILFISATNPSEFAASLNSIGISYKVGYSVAIALRYIPDIQRDYHNISQAQQARGVELGKKEPFFKRMKNSVNIPPERNPPDIPPKPPPGRGPKLPGLAPGPGPPKPPPGRGPGLPNPPPGGGGGGGRRGRRGR